MRLQISHIPKRGTHPQLSVHVYCGQTDGWMKAPLGTEVALVPGQIVLDGDPALPQKGHSSPHLFGPCLLWPRSPISATAELLFDIILYTKSTTAIELINSTLKRTLHNTVKYDMCLYHCRNTNRDTLDSLYCTKTRD